MQSLLMNICLHFPLFSMHSSQTHMRLIGRLPTKIPNADIVNHKESMEQLQIAVIKLDDAELEYIQHTLWMARISLLWSIWLQQQQKYDSNILFAPVLPFILSTTQSSVQFRNYWAINELLIAST